MHTKDLIFICGFMGCGKTTQGKKLAKELAYFFIDLDEYIANKFDENITDLFKEYGEEKFRIIETDALKECIKENQKTIIATGGGTPCFNDNLTVMKEAGKIIYLKMTAAELFTRLFKVKDSRPLIKDKEDEEMLTFIENLLQLRENFYNQADVIIDGNIFGIDHIKNKIL
ncbi:MAG: shikimate kinase [Bacteroidota bacterium]